MSSSTIRRMCIVPLADLIQDVKTGFAIGEREANGVIQIRMNNVDVEGNLDLASVIRVPATSKQVADCSLKAGDVLFNNTNSTELVGKSALFCGHSAQVTFSNHFTRLRVNPQRVDPRYLARWLSRQQKLRVFEGLSTRWVGQSAVRTEKLLALEIPLPPLPEQKRIADILDKADAIRRKRREAEKSTEELMHSLFMTSVGPHAEGYSKWPTRTIGDLAATRPNSMRTGPFGSSLLHSEFVDEGVAVLGIDNAVRNRFSWDERRFISHRKYEELKRYTVIPGDVLITIMGTVGRSAVVPPDIPQAINTKHLACITPDPNRAVPEFLSQAVFRHPEVLRQLGMAGRGAIMTGLNLGIIRSIRLAVPPISIQHIFDNAVAAIRKTEARLNAAKSDAEHLFNALVGSAFRGEQ